MAITSISIDPERLARARALTHARSNKDVVDLALRRLIAHESKTAMVDAIAALSDLPEGLGSATVGHPHEPKAPGAAPTP
ncbi:VapB protein of antitoxin of type II toxin-antitoxin system [Sediminihabitans luteus]|uniref:VapB protein of antitoxin of type II toxin-antitoxin system n=1 Tax=Sediminihabitans luteus TaxID=1138585 RepID=A0A2M9CPW6_9CELL|nr:type II toxin-antitoxin system VapB family antitoxin [Sediminihabitans luteus]PJJ73901.1 VapB protein of antitoxin of type II toxin-antitoxin system [Sediminihabitans luteus]GII98187.1 hypothetical protein Slu03_05650 [Sediminihabitans luteus]